MYSTVEINVVIIKKKLCPTAVIIIYVVVFFSFLFLFVMTGVHKGCKGKTKPESTTGADNN